MDRTELLILLTRFYATHNRNKKSCDIDAVVTYYAARMPELHKALLDRYGASLSAPCPTAAVLAVTAGGTVASLTTVCNVPLATAAVAVTPSIACAHSHGSSTAATAAAAVGGAGGAADGAAAAASRIGTSEMVHLTAQQKTGTKRKVRRSSVKEDPHAPKPPPSSYDCFSAAAAISETGAAALKAVGLLEFTKSLRLMWRNNTNKCRTFYARVAAEKKQEYERKLAEYQATERWVSFQLALQPSDRDMTMKTFLEDNSAWKDYFRNGKIGPRDIDRVMKKLKSQENAAADAAFIASIPSDIVDLYNKRSERPPDVVYAAIDEQVDARMRQWYLQLVATGFTGSVIAIAAAGAEHRMITQHESVNTACKTKIITDAGTGGAASPAAVESCGMTLPPYRSHSCEKVAHVEQYLQQKIHEFAQQYATDQLPILPGWKVDADAVTRNGTSFKGITATCSTLLMPDMVTLVHTSKVQRNSFRDLPSIVQWHQKLRVGRVFSTSIFLLAQPTVQPQFEFYAEWSGNRNACLAERGT